MDGRTGQQAGKVDRERDRHIPDEALELVP